MKKALKISGGLVLLFLTASLIDQLWCLRRLDGSDFETKAWKIEEVSTISSTSYIGISHDRAYLQHWSFGRWQDIVYWTPLSELPADLAARLKAGDPPWQSPEQRYRR